MLGKQSDPKGHSERSEESQRDRHVEFPRSARDKPRDDKVRIFRLFQQPLLSAVDCEL